MRFFARIVSSISVLLVNMVPFSVPANAQDLDDGQYFFEMAPEKPARQSAVTTLGSAIQKLVPSGNFQTYQIFETGSTWTSNKVTVCFYGGSQELRSDIAAVAAEWNANGSPVKLDFGDMSSPRLCASAPNSEIRVGYAGKGGSSMIGNHSLDYPGEASLQLGSFDTNRPAEGVFRAMILHEFGHALGLLHEMKHDDVDCWSEIDPDKLYEYYKTEYNVSDKNFVKTQLQRYDAGVFASLGTLPFERESVMMYALPETLFYKGKDSKCYTTLRTALDSSDYVAIKDLYGQRSLRIARLLSDTAGLGKDHQAVVNAYVGLALSDDAARKRINSILAAKGDGDAIALATDALEALQKISIERYGIR